MTKQLIPRTGTDLSSKFNQLVTDGRLCLIILSILSSYHLLIGICLIRKKEKSYNSHRGYSLEEFVLQINLSFQTRYNLISIFVCFVLSPHIVESSENDAPPVLASEYSPSAISELFEYFQKLKKRSYFLRLCSTPACNDRAGP